MRFLHRNPPNISISVCYLVDYGAKNAPNPPYTFNCTLSNMRSCVKENFMLTMTACLLFKEIDMFVRDLLVKAVGAVTVLFPAAWAASPNPQWLFPRPGDSNVTPPTKQPKPAVSQPTSLQRSPHYASPWWSALAGLIEQTIFHPVDTGKVRLQNSTHPIYSTGDSLGQVRSAIAKAVFEEAYHKGVVARVSSLYQGLQFAMGYKVWQRTIQFAGQPRVKALLDEAVGDQVREYFGKQTAPIVLSGMAGSLMGTTELSSLWIERLKVLFQTNPMAKQKGILQLIQAEGLHLFYRGWGVTLLRNIPGGAILFALPEMVKFYCFGLQKPQETTLSQTVVASSAGAVASILATNPMDVVRTRLLSASGASSSVSACSIFQAMSRNEGLSVFAKGLVPKLSVTAPKLVLTMTLVQWLPKLGAKLVGLKDEKEVQKQEASRGVVPR